MDLASVIILNWNKADDVCDALASVVKQDYPHIEIIVVDNDSKDDSVEKIRAAFPGAKLITLPENIGCPSGRNVGAKAASGEVLFFLDDDGVYKESQLITETMRFFSDDKKLGALYFKVCNYYSLVPDAPLCRDRTYVEQTFPSPSFRGGASAIRRTFFLDYGGYPNDFFRQCEERYLSLKIYDSGHYILYYPEFTMLHKENTYAGKNNLVLRYQVHNEIKTLFRLYSLKYLPPLFLIKFLNSLLLFIKNGMLMDFIRLFIIIPKWYISKKKFDIPLDDRSILIYEGLKHQHFYMHEDFIHKLSNMSITSIIKNKLYNFSK